MKENGKDQDVTYRSIHREREYGGYWYSGLWRILRPILVSLTVGVIVVGLLMSLWNRLYREYAGPVDAKDDQEILFAIESGQSLTRVANNLEKAGLIHSKSVFKYYCDFAGMGQKLQIGQYSLNRAMSMTEIADQLTTGDGNPLVRNITLIPGESIEEFAAKLVRGGVLQSADTLLAKCRTGQDFRDYYYIADVLNGGTASQRKYVLEGYLAADTYEVYVTATEDDILRKLLSQTEAMFPAELQERMEELGLSMDQTLTLASLIEKEAGQNDFAKGQRRVPQPAEGEDEAAERRHHPLHHRRQEDGAGGAGSEGQQSLQHLCGQRPAGGTDLQPLRGGHPGGPESGSPVYGGKLSVLLRQESRKRRAVFFPDAGGA